MAYNGSRSVKPSGVNAYSTLGGTTGYTVRSTRPYHSNFLSVWINIFCEIPSIIRCKSLSRLCSCLRANTTRIVHFPETTSNPWRVPSIALSWPATLSSRVCRCFVMLFLQNLLPGKYSTFSFVLHRREVLCYSSLCQTKKCCPKELEVYPMQIANITHPLAITMWDFSWLERRWPGAGYEDWDRILDELKELGYDAVRIDPYPHLLASDPHREWELLPVWNQQVWGSPALNRVSIQPALNQFLEKCRERAIKVALSSWFRQDRDDKRLLIKTPQDLGRIWQQTLENIADAGLLDTILYVDLCNEFPSHLWAPFFSPQASDKDRIARGTPEGKRWMSEAIAVARVAYPELDYCFSFISEYEKEQDVSFLDFLELHIFMTMWSDFDQQVDYHYKFDDSTGNEHMVQKAET